MNSSISLQHIADSLFDFQEDPPAEALCNEIDQIWTSFTAFVPAEQQKKVVKWKHTKQDMSKVLAIIETEPKPDGLQDVSLSVIVQNHRLIYFSD